MVLVCLLILLCDCQRIMKFKNVKLLRAYRLLTTEHIHLIDLLTEIDDER